MSQFDATCRECGLRAIPCGEDRQWRHAPICPLRCPMCGHQWQAEPHRLGWNTFRSVNCPVCNAKGVEAHAPIPLQQAGLFG